MKYEPVIGLEVHAQLKTKSKIFCGCPTEFGGSPNDHVCPVCLGMPGVLPVLNERAVELAVRTGLALNCWIAETTKFDRKNYFYPDLPKDYQISQYDQPICREGYLLVNNRKVRIHRAHLEEDAGKLVHAGAAGLHGSAYSLVDFNRCGVPLLEIVSEPDISSPDEARLYLTELRTILRYIDVCDGDLEKGSFRCDANVSVRPAGQEKLGTKTELKNMNSFRAVQRAIQYEIDRHSELLDRGEQVVQETRLWNEATGTTHPMRSKEEAHDYRYFPEPDLVPLVLERSFVEQVKRTLPELPEQRRRRYVEELGLSAGDAYVLVESKEMSDFFDCAVALGTTAKAAANWLMGPTLGYLKDSKLEFSDLAITPENLRDLVASVEQGVLSSTTAKQVLLEVFRAPGQVEEIIEKQGLAQVSDESGIRQIVSQVLASNPEQVESYRQGKAKVRQYFFGETMKAMKGKANPQVVNKVLDELLG
ncbi:MAG TPA: Asp-tRNA(Asn)/Glu-tRNA(Gln) amidotransferase subunit GatB [Candidatus Obscuribacterales bacterium]